MQLNYFFYSECYALEFYFNFSVCNVQIINHSNLLELIIKDILKKIFFISSNLTLIETSKGFLEYFVCREEF